MKQQNQQLRQKSLTLSVKKGLTSNEILAKESFFCKDESREECVIIRVKKTRINNGQPQNIWRKTKGVANGVIDTLRSTSTESKSKNPQLCETVTCNPGENVCGKTIKFLRDAQCLTLFT